MCDHERTALGSGQAVFEAACDALRAWKMFDLGWTSVVDPTCPLIAGREVGVLARVGFLWTLNACRILDVFDEPGRRLGFVYGTLDEHVEQGEERFLVKLDSANRVWFDLLAISRPHRWYMRIASPVARFFQRRFRRDAAAAMLLRRAIGRESRRADSGPRCSAFGSPFAFNGSAPGKSAVVQRGQRPPAAECLFQLRRLSAHRPREQIR